MVAGAVTGVPVGVGAPEASEASEAAVPEAGAGVWELVAGTTALDTVCRTVTTGWVAGRSKEAKRLTTWVPDCRM
jgi:hypothetical protein